VSDFISVAPSVACQAPACSRMWVEGAATSAYKFNNSRDIAGLRQPQCFRNA
jgi:hypothetical protein